MTHPLVLGTRNEIKLIRFFSKAEEINDMEILNCGQSHRRRLATTLLRRSSANHDHIGV